MREPELQRDQDGRCQRRDLHELRRRGRTRRPGRAAAIALYEVLLEARPPHSPQIENGDPRPD